MDRYDLGIAYKWIYDKEFINQIEEIFHSKSLTTYIIHEHNVDEATKLIKNNHVSFNVYLDRGSDEDENFEEIAQFLKDSDTRIINHYDLVDDAIDKSVMHQKLLENNILVPKTIILPPFEEDETFSFSEESLNELGIPFIIKPAYYSGGGDDVNVNGKSIDEIIDLRKKLYDDSILLQKKVYPKEIGKKRIWIRSLYAFGNCYHLLWNDSTKIYDDELDFANKNLDTLKLNNLMNMLAEISGFDYFSSEIAITENDEYYLIDYVNDQCDMRKKTQHADGVPDLIVEKYINNMAEFVTKY